MSNTRPIDVSTNNENPLSQDVFEKECASKGLHFLRHKTSIGYLAAILKSRHLIPRAKQTKPNQGMGGDERFVYLAPYKYHESKEKYYFYNGTGKDFQSALLLFSVSLLIDRSDYFANYGRHYGEFLETLPPGPSYRSHPSVLPAAIQSNSINIADLKRGEICFKNPIDLSEYLVEIWVHPTIKDWLIEDLKREKVDPVWLNKIVSYEFHPTVEQHFADMKSREENNKKSEAAQQLSANNRKHQSPKKSFWSRHKSTILISGVGGAAMGLAIGSGIGLILSPVTLGASFVICTLVGALVGTILSTAISAAVCARQDKRKSSADQQVSLRTGGSTNDMLKRTPPGLPKPKLESTLVFTNGKNKKSDLPLPSAASNDSEVSLEPPKSSRRP